MISLIGPHDTATADALRTDRAVHQCLTTSLVCGRLAIPLDRVGLSPEVQAMGPDEFQAWFIQQMLPEILGYVPGLGRSRLARI